MHVTGKHLLLMIGLAVASPAWAFDEPGGGRWTVGPGYAMAESRASTSSVELNGAPLPEVEMLVGDDRASLLWLRRRLGDEWALSTALGKPLTVEAQLRNRASGDDIPALPIDAAPLMLTLQYAPRALRVGGLQPYVGAGAVYVLVDAGGFYPGFNDFSEQVLGQRPVDFDMDRPWHALWELGADYRMSDHWLLNARVLGFSGSSRARMQFDGGSVMEVDIEYAPRIYSLSLEYRF